MIAKRVTNLPSDELHDTYIANNSAHSPSNLTYFLQSVSFISEGDCLKITYRAWPETYSNKGTNFGNK